MLIPYALLYRHSISKVTEKSLNAFYCACSYAKVDYFGFMCTIARMALKIIPKNISYHSVFLCIDDIMMPKMDTKFKKVSRLYNHAEHNGTFYLNGHCFISLMIYVTVRKNRKISYLLIPSNYKILNKTKSKILLTAEMIHYVMSELYRQKILYLCLLKSFICVANFNIICAARVDYVIYDIVLKRTGKVECPKKHGERLSAKKDFILSNEKINGYFTGTRIVLTNLFGNHMVHAYVTSTLRKSSTKRLFFSTISLACITFAYA